MKTIRHAGQRMAVLLAKGNASLLLNRIAGCLMTELGAVRLHGRGVARLHDDWISLRGGGRRKFAS